MPNSCGQDTVVYLLHVIDHELKIDSASKGSLHRFGIPRLPTSVECPMCDHDLCAIQGQVSMGVASALLYYFDPRVLV